MNERLESPRILRQGITGRSTRTIMLRIIAG
jgi:hypothetical protein